MRESRRRERCGKFQLDGKPARCLEYTTLERTLARARGAAQGRRRKHAPDSCACSSTLPSVAPDARCVSPALYVTHDTGAVCPSRLFTRT
jgi:hypothetical protein